MRTNGIRLVALSLVAVACLGAGGSPRLSQCRHPADFVPDGVACSCGHRMTAEQTFYEHVYKVCKDKPEERAKHILVDRVECRHCHQRFQRPHAHQFFVLEHCPSGCAEDVKARICHCGEKRCPDPRQSAQAMCWSEPTTIARK